MYNGFNGYNGVLSEGDHVQRLLTYLRRPDDRRDDHRWNEHMEAEWGRSLNPESFVRIEKDVLARISACAKSADAGEKAAAVDAVDTLVDLKITAEQSQRIGQLVRSIKLVLNTCGDANLLKRGARVMGRLVASGGNLTAELVSSEVHESLEYLRRQAHNCTEQKRLVACFVLKELAENSPAAVNVHVRRFLDDIWCALKDTRLEVRTAAVGALRAFLMLIERRETRYRVQWWYRLFEQTMWGLVRPFRPNERDVEAHVHASLLALGELLQHSREFMLARYKQAADTILSFRESRHSNVKQQVMLLIPKMSEFAPEKFVLSYLEACAEHLLHVLDRSPSWIAFQAFGQMLSPLGGMATHSELQRKMADKLPRIEAELVKVLTYKSSRDSSKRKACMEAITCVCVLTEALGTSFQQYVIRLLKPLILTGLSDPLVKCLGRIGQKLPDIEPLIQSHLLLPVLSALPTLSDGPPGGGGTLLCSGRLRDSVARRTCFHVRPSVLRQENLEDFAQEVQAQVTTQMEEDAGKHKFVIKVALDTLCNVDFGLNLLLPFAATVLLQYAHSEDAAIRTLAAQAVWRVMERQWGVLTRMSLDADWDGSETLVQARGHIEHVVASLLSMAATDVDAGVRKATIQCFRSTFSAGVEQPTKSLQIFFSQLENIRPLVLCLNDPSPSVCLGALTMMGLLAPLNPAATVPVMRRHLTQLLTDIERSMDPSYLDKSAQLLAEMIEQCPHLIRPNLDAIVEGLVGRLRDARQQIETSEDGRCKSGHSMTDSIMHVMAVLVNKMSVRFLPFVPQVLPLVNATVCDPRTEPKHMLMAVHCLGAIVGSTGCVINPYMQFPRLMPSLLRLLSLDNPGSLHVEVVKLVGIVGALGPHTHNLNQARLEGEDKLDKDGVRGMRSDRHPQPSLELLPATSDDKYSNKAINALLNQLRDPQVGAQRQEVLNVLMFILRDLKLGSVAYLPAALPVLLRCARVKDEGMQDFVVKQLVDLVRLVQGHMRKWLKDFLTLILDHWDTKRPKLLQLQLLLLSHIARVLQEDIRAHVGTFVPKFVELLHEAERLHQLDMLESALEALEALGLSLDHYFHMLLPALVALLPIVHSSSTPLDTRRSLLANLTRLMGRMKLAPFASAVLQPLIQTLREAADPELRADTLNTMCSLAVAIGDNMALFVPAIRAALAETGTSSERWERIARALQLGRAAAPADRGSGWSDAGGWAQELDLVQHHSRASEPPQNPRTGVPGVSYDNLKKAWESSHRSTKMDWLEWMRRLGVELLAHSTNPSLRACHQLALVQPALARELFSVGFVSCWTSLDEAHQQELVQSLKATLSNPSIPPEIVTTLLNLAEFMEHDEKPLPLDTRTLGALAEKCHTFAKALHYKEIEYREDPLAAAESLIQICHQLRLPDAAQGVLTDIGLSTGDAGQDPITPSMYEKLQHYDKALEIYRKCQKLPKHDYWGSTLGIMRCHAARAEWEKLLEIANREWTQADIMRRQEMRPVAAHAAWHMDRWDCMEKYLDPTGRVAHTSSMDALLDAVLAIQKGREKRSFEKAEECISRARDLLSTELVALVGESYERAYPDLIRAQQCTELTEVIQFLKSESMISRIAGGDVGAGGDPVHEINERYQLIREVWRMRLLGVERTVDVWTRLLGVRRLVLQPADDVDVYLKYATMCRKEGMERLAWRTLTGLLKYDPMTVPKGSPGYGAGSGNPMVMLACLKHQWEIARTHRGGNKERGLALLERLTDLVNELQGNPQLAGMRSTLAEGSPMMPIGQAQHSSILAAHTTTAGRSTMTTLRATGGGRCSALNTTGAIGSGVAPRPGLRPSLIAKAFFYKATWNQILYQKNLTAAKIEEVNGLYKAATQEAASWGKAWHKLGLFNMILLLIRINARRPVVPQGQERGYVITALQSFFQSVALSGGSERHKSLQDVLRILVLWFRYGQLEEVSTELRRGFSTVPIDTWLLVVPQMMARLNMDKPSIVKPLVDLLIKLGRNHPQALLYPLLVAKRCASATRRSNAELVIEEIKSHSPQLVLQMQQVSEELVRIAILWHEQWHEALEEASKHYFGERNVDAMLSTLLPLHAKLQAAMENSPEDETRSEKMFKQTYGPDLNEAYECCKKFQQSAREHEVQQAWDLYYGIYRRIDRQLPTVHTLRLSQVSHILASSNDMDIAVPGTYSADHPTVHIHSFDPDLQVMLSKQRPRKLTIHGSDGAEYQFLLKGHEDLRLDERIMQLFGLVNNLLSADRKTAERRLSIARYAVIPLSPNSGLIGWVRNCDTLHALIREYRDAKHIHLNVEHKIMQSVAPNYDPLMVIQKIEVFEEALARTSGDDLHKVLWNKSRSSEVWLEKRTNYTRSTAVMSMVGYILGLGDRHPSNLMLDRYSGKLVHIDFGDCFEASMQREKYPELVPFRLTRMMVKAMEVVGTAGSFQHTCEYTIEVLRQDRITVIALLEAFLHDPLINWRLLNRTHDRRRPGGPSAPLPSQEPASSPLSEAHPGSPGDASTPTADLVQSSQLHQFVDTAQADANAELTEMAKKTMKRMADKLTGKDFSKEPDKDKKDISVTLQVEKLIQKATSNELLCQSYIGWCPFW